MQPTMIDLATRFWVLQRKYVEFLEKTPSLLRHWLERQSPVVGLQVSLEKLAHYLFYFDAKVDIPVQWLHTMACCALRDQLSWIPNVQLSQSSVTFSDIPSTLGIQWPLHSQFFVATRLPDTEAMLRERNAVLSVRVLELETKLNSGGLNLKMPRTSAPPPPAVAMDTLALLLGKRFEAEDALAMLQRVQSEFVGRKRALDSACSELVRVHAEQRRTDAKQARLSLALSTEEISRLKTVVEKLRSRNTDKLSLADTYPIAPRRALVLAGFWNVAPNDLLHVTPHLVARFERTVGGVIRHGNLQVCFPAKDQAILIDVVVEVMAEHLPQYSRAQPPGGFFSL